MNLVIQLQPGHVAHPAVADFLQAMPFGALMGDEMIVEVPVDDHGPLRQLCAAGVVRGWHQVAPLQPAA